MMPKDRFCAQAELSGKDNKSILFLTEQGESSESGQWTVEEPFLLRSCMEKSDDLLTSYNLAVDESNFKPNWRRKREMQINAKTALLEPVKDFMMASIISTVKNLLPCWFHLKNNISLDFFRL